MQRRKVLLAIRRSQTRSGYVSDLSQNGFEAVTADHGLECLTVLCWFSPDVIVLEPELQWGGGDGVLALLQEMPDLRDIPVVLLTTDFNRSAVYSISQFSVSDFWVQPITPECLTGRVTRLVIEHQWPMTSRRFFSST